MIKSPALCGAFFAFTGNSGLLPNFFYLRHCGNWECLQYPFGFRSGSVVVQNKAAMSRQANELYMNAHLPDMRRMRFFRPRYSALCISSGFAGIVGE